MGVGLVRGYKGSKATAAANNINLTGPVAALDNTVWW